MKLLIAQYRLPYPLYISGADKFTIEFATWMHDSKYSVCAMYCMGIYSISEIESKCKHLNLDYFVYSDRVDILLFNNFLVSIYTPDAFFKNYYMFLKDNPDAVVMHYLNVFSNKRGGLHRFKDWKKLFSVKQSQCCFVHSEDILDECYEFKLNFDVVFCNSEFIKKRVKQRWKKDAKVILPLPTADCVFEEKNKFSKYITFFNPTKLKGSDIVYELIQRNPDRYFMIVLGWSCNLEFPEELNLSDKVLIIPPQQNVAEIYSYSRLVIVPSQWEEPFGRVMFEAAFNDIPVCISKVGGMKQYFCNNGILVKDYKNVAAWQDAIEKFDDDKFYNDVVQNCEALSIKYKLEAEYKKLLDELKSL